MNITEQIIEFAKLFPALGTLLEAMRAEYTARALRAAEAVRTECRRDLDAKYYDLKSMIRSDISKSRTWDLTKDVKTLTERVESEITRLAGHIDTVRAAQDRSIVISVGEASLRAKIEAVIAQMKHTSRKYSVDLQYDTGYDHAINAFTDQLKDALK